MENNKNSSDEQIQSGQNSPTNGSDLQQANEERFNHLQSEMSTLKTMMERLIAQNEERNRQLDASTATSSFVVRTSNMLTGVNRSDRDQRNHFQDEEDEEDYEDTPSNTTETALLNAIQDLPSKLQKINTKLPQTHESSTMSSSICYVTTPDQSPKKITEEDKIHFFRAYSVTKPSTFGKRLQSAQPPHCKTSSNYSERKTDCRGRHERDRPIQME